MHNHQLAFSIGYLFLNLIFICDFLPFFLSFFLPLLMPLVKAQYSPYLQEYTTRVISITPIPQSNHKEKEKKGKDKTPASSSSSSSSSPSSTATTASSSAPSTHFVEFEDTILYPEGGGQPFDQGILLPATSSSSSSSPSPSSSSSSSSSSSFSSSLPTPVLVNAVRVVPSKDDPSIERVIHEVTVPDSATWFHSLSSSFSSSSFFLIVMSLLLSSSFSSSSLPPFLSHLSSSLSTLHFSQDTLLCALCIVLAPLIWNILARLCRVITRGKSKTFQYTCCYILAIWIFSFSSFRDYLFSKAIDHQQKPYLFPSLTDEEEKVKNYIAFALFGIGQLFVWSSFLRLGITGTFLGDYCGILMDSRVTGFPFNVLDNPMYVGSTMSFLASSLYKNTLVGLLLTIEVFIVYQIALMFEGPYTAKIYREREQQKAQKKK